MNDKIIQAIDSERQYQDEKWGNTLSGGRSGNGERSVDEFILYIAGYSNELARLTSVGGCANDLEKLNVVRKIAGLCVHCMEQHGAPIRDMGIL